MLRLDIKFVRDVREIVLKYGAIMYKKIANWLLSHSDGKNYNVDILIYGLEVIGATWGKTLFFLLLGLCSGYLTETVVVLLVFSGLRSQAGGRHCKTSWGCSLTMISIIYGSILFGKLVKLPDFLMVICFAFYVFLLYEYAPYCTEKHPISDKSEIRRRKRNSIIIVFFILLTELIIQDRQVKDIIFLACSIEVFSTISLKDVNRMIIRTRD